MTTATTDMSTHTARSADGTDVTTLRIAPPRVAPVVIVPGGLDRAESWRRVATRIATEGGGRETVVLRRPGARSGRDYSLDREVEDLASVLEQHGPAHLVGHSYGALIVVRALVDASVAGGVRSAAVYEPVLRGQGDPPIVGEHYDRLHRAVDRGADAVTAAVYDYLVEVAAYPCALARHIAGKHAVREMVPGLLPELRAAEQAPWDDRYSDIGTPMLLLRGELSAPHPCWTGCDALARVLPAAVSQTITGAGHTAHHTAPVSLAHTLACWMHSHD